MHTGALKLFVTGAACAAFSLGCSREPARSAVNPAEPWVHLHLTGSRGATLQRLMDDDWVSICRVPCNGAIPASGRFRIVASTPSTAFSMPGSTGGTVTLRAEDDGRVYTLDSSANSSQVVPVFLLLP
jgi:hypothetical protein